jgi:FkbM family methyltransferase
MVNAGIGGAVIQLDLRSSGDRSLFYRREYEPAYIATLRRLYRDGNFLDIGSNVGIYGVSMAPAVRAARGRIFSVEPVPPNVARQRINVELNRCADIVDLAQVVLGDERGTVHIAGDFASANVNGVVIRDGDNPMYPMTTLDLLAAERGWDNVTVVKIDTEGFDPAVLRGGEALITRCRPIILAEFNRERMRINGFSMSQSWNMLRSLGYEGFALVRGQLTAVTDPAELENLFFIPAAEASRIHETPHIHVQHQPHRDEEHHR